MSKAMDAAFWDISEIAMNQLPQNMIWSKRPSVGTWLMTPSFVAATRKPGVAVNLGVHDAELSRGKAFDSTEQGEKMAHKHGPDGDLFDMVEDSWAGVQGVVANISATGQHKNCWCMRPSVGTWMLQPAFGKSRERLITQAEPDVDDAELSTRRAASDLFWAQVDEEEEHERHFYMESELSLRQAASDYFWAKVDQEEEDERASYMDSELSLRQAASDFFWAKVDQEEEDERASYMDSEFSLRQAAFDFFWAQLDQEEEDARAAYMESELSLRRAAFDFFWAQVDQEEEDERASYIESELSLRQAAFDFFWAQLDQDEEDVKASYIESELSLRRAAFDLFWAQLDQEEEDERASHIESELSLRRAAFDFFWAQVDQDEEDERASYIESELSLRQVAFDFFWAQLDETHSNIDEPEKHHIYAKIVDPEKHSKISPDKIARIPQMDVDGIAQNLEEWPMFSMAGSPAKSIRLAKMSLSLSVDAPPGLSPSQLLSVSHKSNGIKKRSSSTSAMAIDLGHSKAHTSVIDSVSAHVQAVSLKQEHIAKFSVKMGELPPLKKAKMCVTVPSPELPRTY